MGAGGQVINGAAGDLAALITSSDYGILAVGVAATVTNLGTIDTGYVGVDLRADGTVINGSSTDNTALVQGRYFGVRLENAGTITNYGTIGGTNGTALSLESSSDLLRVAAGATFDGDVLGGNGTLELMSSAVAGTLSGLGTQFTAFNSIQDDAGATWTLSGANTVSAGSTLLNSGTLVNAGTLTNDGTLVNAGALLDNGVLINNGVATLSATLTVAGTLSNFGSIDVGAYRALALAPGAYLYNAAGAIITQTGSANSFEPTVFGDYGGAVDIRNLGTIANATGEFGLLLPSGGTITNGSSSDTAALITGAVPIYIYQPGTVTNFGTIESTASYGGGLVLISGGSVTNGAAGSSAAVIIAADYGIVGIYGSTTLTNFGTISATNHGVDQRYATATVLNTGIIRATGETGVGVYLHSGGTIIDAGTIAGATTAIYVGGTASNLVVLEQGYALTGAVVGGDSATNTLELQGSTIAPVTATYNSLGLVNFETIAFASDIGNDATLVISNDAQLPGTIAGFIGTRDAIDLTGLSDTGNDAIVNFDALTDVLTVTGDNGSVQLQLDSEDYSGTRFLASNDGSDGTMITPEAVAPPVIGGTVAGQAANDETADQPFASVTIADDNTPTQTVTVTVILSNGGSPTDADGALSGAGLTQTGVGTYTLTAASAAAAQAALQALVFTPAEHQVAPGDSVTTDFQIEVTDGFGLTTTDTTTSVVVTAVNDPPTINPPTGGDTGVPDQAPIAPFADLTVTDPDVGHIDTLTVTLSDPSGGTLSNLGGGSYDAETGVYTVTGTGDAVTAALRALVFTPAAAIGGSVSPTSFTVVATGPGGDAENTGITIISVPQVFGFGNIPPNQVVISISPDGTGFAPPTPDMTNEAVISDPSEGGSYSLPTGYQAEFLGGSADAMLSDASVGNALLVGNTGNDTITASAGNDTLLGGAGDSTLSISGANDIATDPTGNATVMASGSQETVYGGTGTLTALATGTSDAIGLGSGAANVTLGGSDNTVYAYTGASTIVATGTGDVVGLYTGDANVTLGGSGNALYAGGGSSSIVASGSGNKIGLGAGAAAVSVSGSGTGVFGDTGAMSVLMSGDTDTIFGASGAINATLAGAGDVVGAGTGTTTLLVTGANATIFGNATRSHLLADVEGANAVVGLDTGDANLTLSGGNAQVFANGGASTILASGSGSDTINLSAGPSSITAAGSTDLLVGTDRSGSLLFAGGAGASTVIGGGATTMLGASGGVITYVGEAGANASFTAAGGNETLNAALSGAAVVANGSSIAGSADVLVGGAGNDTLSAGVGTTTMTGGGGANVFEFAHVGGGSVTVTDFNSNDTVLLNGYGGDAATTALANAASSNGSTTITLSDNTRITFLDVASTTSLTGHVISG